LAEQAVPVQPERLGRVVAHLTHDEITAVDKALRTVFDL
jgi:mRNA-degrading endonuclease toxin of MazEF toxin-antitoxin module